MVSSHRCIATAAIGVFALAATIATVSAATSSQQQQLQGFVGTWSCVTHTADNKSYRETDTDTMYGNWLRVASAYPAQAGAPAGTATTFVGYDSKHTHWIVTGVGTDGSYFTSYSNSPAFDGSKWIDAYPNDHGTALFHMPSSASYTMDTTGPDQKGKMSSSHTVCTKQ
jgi:hypothetical protein